MTLKELLLVNTVHSKALKVTHNILPSDESENTQEKREEVMTIKET